MRHLFLCTKSAKMTTVFIKLPWTKPQCYHECTTQALVSAVGLSTESYYMVCNGKLTQLEDQLQNGATYYVVPRILGGKGGFGSMLRAIGAQIEKTTNREACRDLSGRRMRDVNNEKQLREWVGKQAEREQEKERRKKERLERRKAVPKHHFDDPEYMQQKSLVADNLHDALQQGLQRVASSTASSSTSTSATAGPSTSSGATGDAGPSTSSGATAGPSSTYSRKRISQTVTSSSTSAKKSCFWMGIEDLEGLDSDSDSDDQAQPGPSGIPANAMRVDLPDNDTSDSALSSSPSDLSDKDKSDSGVELESGSLSHISILVPNRLQLNPAFHAAAASDSDAGEHKMEVEPDSTGEAGEGSASCKESDNAISSSEDTQADTAKQQSPEGKHGLLALLPQPSMQPSQTAQMEPENFTLEDYNSVAELEALGLDFLKSVLMYRGLKCGGTLQQRAERLFAVKGLAPDQIDRSLLAKPAKGSKK